MRIETVKYEADVQLIGTLYLPDNVVAAPGVIVFPDIFGLGDHARERAERLAERGYVALAADFHGGGQILPVELAMEALNGFYAEPSVPCGRGKAAFDYLRNVPGVDASRISAMGYCYGGTLALEMARLGEDLAAVVGFHSGLATKNPNGASRVKGKVLVCIGSEDPAISTTERNQFEEEMRAGGVDWQIHVYGGVYHTFTDRRCDALGRPDFARYSPEADHRSSLAMNALLDEVSNFGC